MKRLKLIWPVFLVVVVLAGCALAYENWGSLENQVVVKRLNVELPTGEIQISDFLWNNFANKPEADKFEEESSAGWEKIFHRYEKNSSRRRGGKILIQIR